ncbi:MAG: ribosome small subunit-dependent GTPase A [Sediminibacterium sp.]|nr:ribosome small subunit-dependent GTPase A [Chitinophagaceae bacterium]MCA6446922.1 ribosome small subunit-dependent GTPase A [Chitinophagaceae bacterium]
MKAIVYKSTGSWYVVKTADGQFHNARVKGIFKIDGITSTNPIAVGDEVNISFENTEEASAVIEEISDRHNYVARVSPHNKRQHHIIASNIDQSLLFVTLKSPKTSLGFIDRFLIACESFHIPATIVFNKADIYREKEIQQYERYREIYTDIGYDVLLTSVEKGEGLEDVRKKLVGKKSLLGGHSGVGKSTLINALFPDYALRTQEVSSWSGKGMHTTTFAEMFDIDENSKVIDTPGIRELGITAVSKQELSHYFPEMRKVLNDCQFNNCMHYNEPGCAVKQAVGTGVISEERYVSYLTIKDTIEENLY